MSYSIELREIAFTAQKVDKLIPSPHMHTHLEMIYITKGESIAILDNQKYRIEAGNIFIAFPNQIHLYQDQLPIQGYLVIFTPETLGEFKEIFQKYIPFTPIVKDNSIPMDVRECMERIIRKLDTGTALDKSTAKGHLLALLGEIFSHIRFVNQTENPETIKRILNYCMENYAEPLTLEYVAKKLYLNKYYISHIFRDRLNVNFKDFINRLRVEHACELLKKGHGVTETAYASGFTSLRTFNRVFFKYMNMTPREMIKQTI